METAQVGVGLAHYSLQLSRFEVVTVVSRLAKKEHSAALAQLASRTSAIMKFGVGAGVDPFVKVKGLFTDLINRLQAEASSEASHKSRGRCWEAIFQTRSGRGQIHRSGRRSAGLRPSSTSLVSPFQRANDCAMLIQSLEDRWHRKTRP